MMQALPRAQIGAILPVSLFILLIVTLLVVSSSNTTNTSLQLVLNQQANDQAAHLSAQLIQRTVADIDNFLPCSNPDSNWRPASGDCTDPAPPAPNITGGGFTTVLNKPECIGQLDIPGYSSQIEYPPQRIYWEFSTETNDALTGARNLTTQGVRIRMLNGSCTPL